MQVMCIKDDWIPAQTNIQHWPAPVFGDIDEVLDCLEMFGKEVYKLARFGHGVGYITTHFIPLSDIDEHAEALSSRQRLPAYAE